MTKPDRNHSARPLTSTKSGRDRQGNALGGFDKLAKRAARVTGRPAAFSIAVLLIVAWATTGPLFRFSDTWQLVINTATTVVTFLMVFLIQNTQDRESQAVQLKLDEIIRALGGAHNSLIDLETLSMNELDKIRERYVQLARQARKDLTKGLPDTGNPLRRP